MKFRCETPEFNAYKKALFLDLIWWQGRQLTTGPVVPPACTCRYGLFRVPGAPGPWVFTHRPGIRRPEPLTAAFRIDPACPHHGDHR